MPGPTFDWGLFLEAQRTKNENQQKLMQALGLGAATLGQGLGQHFQKNREDQAQNDFSRMLNPQPVQGPTNQVTTPPPPGQMGPSNQTMVPPQQPPAPDLGTMFKTFAQAYPQMSNPFGQAISDKFDPLKQAQANWYNTRAKGGAGTGKNPTDIWVHNMTGEVSQTVPPNEAEWTHYSVPATDALKAATGQANKAKDRAVRNRAIDVGAGARAATLAQAQDKFNATQDMKTKISGFLNPIKNFFNPVKPTKIGGGPQGLTPAERKRLAQLEAKYGR